MDIPCSVRAILTRQSRLRSLLGEMRGSERAAGKAKIGTLVPVCVSCIVAVLICVRSQGRGGCGVAERKGSRRVPAWVVGDWTSVRFGVWFGGRGSRLAPRARLERKDRHSSLGKRTAEARKNVRGAFRVPEAFHLHRYRRGRRGLQLLRRRGGGMIWRKCEDRVL